MSTIITTSIIITKTIPTIKIIWYKLRKQLQCLEIYWDNFILPTCPLKLDGVAIIILIDILAGYAWNHDWDWLVGSCTTCHRNTAALRDNDVQFNSFTIIRATAWNKPQPTFNFSPTLPCLLLGKVESVQRSLQSSMVSRVFFATIWFEILSYVFRCWAGCVVTTCWACLRDLKITLTDKTAGHKPILDSVTTAGL